MSCTEGDRRKIPAEKMRVNKHFLKDNFSPGKCGISRNGDHYEHSHEIIEEPRSCIEFWLELRSARQAGLSPGSLPSP